MKLLLDTHLLLWAATAVQKLPSAARALMEDEQNSLCFSVVSIWEVAIKRAASRRDYMVEPAVLRTGLLDAGYWELTIASPHALATAALPPLHRDPFDRLLVSQASVEGMVLVTSDSVLATYPGPVRLV